MEYGPQFGPGDTVGCGIDFRHSQVFFTLNGEYLGPAFDSGQIDLNQPLYPSAGIDCLNLIEFNFGERPFQFDLARHELGTQTSVDDSAQDLQDSHDSVALVEATEAAELREEVGAALAMICLLYTSPSPRDS
eukprot:TRINITY_DN9273_c0_g2_i2.p1 TRINITY_DN9273_c0_g2~~TRINITY_DN9273_c0_g2_i2.p1  ORF type:complete len:133 (-),score=32.82 TRINITY_DN9273_c0_g2_i2:95-493(-)